MDFGEREPDDGDPWNAGYNCCYDKLMPEIGHLRTESAALKDERIRWHSDNGMLTEQNDRLRAALRSCPCPQNTTPTAGECFETGYCSCGIGAALEQAAGEK